MKRFRSAATLVCAFLAVSTLAIRAAARELVRFKGSLDGVVTHAPIDATHDFVVVEATGNATHIGQFELTAEHVVDTAARVAVGTYVFTAANGDTLTAEFTGRASPTATPGVLAVVETATITEGTGRFEGATGSFVVNRLYDRAAGTTTGSFEGKISTVGSGKH
jgi:hypothetical protein